MPTIVRDEITYPFLNFYGCTVEVWEWIRKVITRFIMDASAYPCWNQSQSTLVKWALSAINQVSAAIRPKFSPMSGQNVSRILDLLLAPLWNVSINSSMRPLTISVLNIFRETYVHFYHFWTRKWSRLFGSSLMEDEDPSMPWPDAILMTCRRKKPGQYKPCC